MADLTGLRDALKAGLSQTPPEAGPSVAKLTERIKQLRTSYTVESAPQKPRQQPVARVRRPRREEPVKEPKVKPIVGEFTARVVEAAPRPLKV